ncbi:hypothetical protein [Ferruginibacter sp. HRS2-29]|uniref:hypothetical protein n=1 Tax=Ferruginibacter sp. HRS2-29 TaxID=2487334 RepID=UPI0020CE217A|nr:hypothetical protein [Ferruginibacter sp. HRS2-29]MCP9753538.1 hypothetical protein [Ferruginibacter sp. HRS2-29]
MKHIFLLIILSNATLFAVAQKETFDLASYAVPKGWKKEQKENVVVYTYVDQKDKSWCQLGVYRNIASKGSVDQDFTDAWQELIAGPYKTTGPTQADTALDVDGWKIKAGAGAFAYNNGHAMALLSAFTGYNRTVDVLAVTNSEKYIDAIEKFTTSIELKKPTTANLTTANGNVQPTKTIADNFAFNTTNFDDGWTSRVQENWVEVTKGGLKVLIHYPNKKADAYYSVLKEGDFNAWDLLVAPRYRNMKNFEWKTIQSWQSITFMEGDATENATGKLVHIVLFKKHVSDGSGKYIEFVSNTKGDYEKEFGVYHNTEFDWDKNANMQYRNKFSVAANDLLGKWSSTDYASISYYYVSSGNLAGSTATSLSDEYNFLPGNNYESQHAQASGVVGTQQFSNQKYKGKSMVTNWNITLTNRFKGASETYDSYFEAVKGGRALIIKDNLNTIKYLVRQ